MRESGNLKVEVEGAEMEEEEWDREIDGFRRRNKIGEKGKNREREKLSRRREEMYEEEKNW